MLTPEDIQKKVFSKGFRGYDSSEVDTFLAMLRKEYEYLYLDNLQLKETVERVSSKLEYYQQLETTMQSTVQVAQQTADEIKANSEKKAAVIEQEARNKSDLLWAETQAKAQKVHDEAMAAAEDLYNKTKLKTENMMSAAQTESSRIMNEAKAYADNLKKSTDVETDRQRANMEDLCKKRVHSAQTEANYMLEEARKEVNRMMLEANTNSRKIMADAEEKSRQMVFNAESRAAAAEATYESQVKKSRLHLQQLTQLLETQLSLVKNYKDSSDPED